MLGLPGKNSFTNDIIILLASVLMIGALGMLSFRRMKAV
jgi:hypothetical protein